MSNKKEIIKLIKERIKQNITKQQIESELATKYQSKEYVKTLKDFPEPALAEKYKNINKALVACLVVATLLKLVFTLFSGINAELGIAGWLVVLVVSLAIPVVLIIYTLSYRASAYILSVVFSLVSLQYMARSLNASVLDYLQIALVLTILILSAFLYKKIYPKKR